MPFCADSCSVQLRASRSSLLANHGAPCPSVSGCGSASNTRFWHLINPLMQVPQVTGLKEKKPLGTMGRGFE